MRVTVTDDWTERMKDTESKSHGQARRNVERLQLHCQLFVQEMSRVDSTAPSVQVSWVSKQK